MTDIEYLTADYDNEKSSIQSVIDAIEGDTLRCRYNNG